MKKAAYLRHYDQPPPPVFNRREYFMPQTLFSGNGRRSLSRIAAARWGRILSRTSCKKSPQDVKEQFATGATSIHSLSPLNALCRFESCVGDQIDHGGGREEGMTGNTPDKSKDMERARERADRSRQTFGKFPTTFRHNAKKWLLTWKMTSWRLSCKVGFFMKTSAGVFGRAPPFHRIVH